MPSKIFDTLLEEQIDFFRSSFSSTAQTVFYDEIKQRLIHPGEFGHYREGVCKTFLRYFIPLGLDIERGFVINPNDEVSTECDLVIYDKAATPLIRSSELQRFFPVETVVSIGEIKSKLTKSELKDALLKLAKAKSLRDGLVDPTILRRLASGPFLPSQNPRDQIFTFLICQKFDFKTDDLVEFMSSIYDSDIHPYHRHNLILSIEDGLLAYHLNTVDLPNRIVPYPLLHSGTVRTALTFPGDRGHPHIKRFVTFLFHGVTYSTVLFPDMAVYVSSRSYPGIVSS